MSAKELDLVSKVDLRLALAESDQQLEQNLQQLLAPLLLKLSSPHADVRQAVFKTIQNIFPRVTAARQLQLPVQALLNQVQHPNVPLGADLYQVRLYSLLFLSKGVERLGREEKALLVPKVIRNISRYPRPVSARVFAILMKLLSDWSAPDVQEHENTRQVYGFNDSPDDEVFLTSQFAKFLMLQPNATSTTVASPGLSVEDNAYFTKDAGISYHTRQDVDKAKMKILDFLKVGFSEKYLALPLLIASADSSSSISDRVNTWFKKLSIDVEDPKFVKQLITLFVGDDKTPPAKPTLQEKILVVLSKSELALSESNVRNIANIGLLSDYAKLRQVTVAFIRRVTKLGKVPLDFNIATSAQLKESIIADGWPQIDTTKVANYRTAIGLRQLQYEALGDILRNTPGIWRNNLEFLRFLFLSLEEETLELRPVIQDALSSLIIHLPELASDCKSELKDILRGYLVNSYNSPNLASCKYIAIKYVNYTFPFEDANARFLCIIGKSKHNNSDTVEEANKGLHPYYFNLMRSTNNLQSESSRDFLGLNSSVEFPTFEDMVITVKEQFESFPYDSFAREQLSEAIRFILNLLVMQSVKGKQTVVVPDEDWIARIDKALEVDKNVRQLVTEQIQLLAQKDVPMTEGENINCPFHTFLEITFDGFLRLTSSGNAFPSNPTYLSVFKLLVSMSPTSIIADLTSQVDKMFALIKEGAMSRAEMKDLCEVFGIVASNTSVEDDYLKTILLGLTIEGKSKQLKEARVLATSFLTSRLLLRGRTEVLQQELVKSFIQSLAEGIKESKNYTTCLHAVSQLAIFGVLGPKFVAYETIAQDVGKILEVVQSKAKTCHELSVTTLAKLALSLPSTYDLEISEASDIEKLIYDTHISKQIDFTFSSGEALAILAGGWEATVLQQNLDVQGAAVEWLPKETNRLPFVLEHVLESCAQTKPALRKAGCIWLLSLVQYLGHMSLIKEKGKEIHVAFMKFLVDRDELIQESASRGLNIIYELGDHELKEELVKSLLRSFTDAKESNSLKAGTVDLETQLFDKDVLKTDDGSVSTYKDVLSLAADVGDPSLVYKFMSLARSNALWSSRKGMAFGLGSILSKTSLDEMFSKNDKLSARLIPRLYRYRFDPNVSVSKSMNDIWNILIKDPSKTLRENFDLILQEVLKSMGSKEWRVRQAGVSALNDLLQTQSLKQLDSHLEQIWKMTFRAMDDIKESVRKEGASLAKALARALMRAADEKNGTMSAEKAAAIMNDLIPFLLGSDGLLSDAEDVRDFALETLLNLCKLGGKTVIKHVPNLLATFIELMSTLEPEILNYLVLNADKFNLNSGEVDARRLQSLGHSPIMDAIEQILRLVDDQLMPIVIQKLQRSIKKSVGLPSKVCGAKVIVSLVTKNYAEVKPYGDKLLTMCIGQLNDRNQTVSSSYATAAGYCCKVGSITEIVNYGTHLKTMYFESEDDDQRILVGMASEAVSRYCGSDVFESVAGAFLPLAFIGRHDPLELVKSFFDREWIESSSGNNAIKVYFEEITTLCKIYGQSPNYNIRKIIAKALADMATTIEIDSDPQTTELLALLLELSKGKSWDGKDLVLKALVGFSTKKTVFLNGHKEILEQVTKTVQTEARRRNKAYQMKAVLSLGQYVHSYPSEVEAVDTYIDVMQTVLTRDYFEEADVLLMSDLENGKTDAQKEAKIEELYLSYIGNIFESLSPSHLNADILKLAHDKMKNLRKSDDVSLTWRTCASFNEHMGILLKSILDDQTELTTSQLDLILEMFTELTNFGEKYRLEKNLVLFARNSKMFIELLSRHGVSYKTQFVLEFIDNLKKENTSTVALYELGLATDN